PGRCSICLWQCSPRRDRELSLPKAFLPLIERLEQSSNDRKKVFSLGPNAIAEMIRVFERAASIARIRKPVTPSTLRRSLAQHLLPHERDVRFVRAIFRGHSLLQTPIYAPIPSRALRR